jgi:hypothetical protein
VDQAASSLQPSDDGVRADIALVGAVSRGEAAVVTVLACVANGTVVLSERARTPIE